MKKHGNPARYTLFAGIAASIAAVAVTWHILMPFAYRASLKFLWATFPWFTWYGSYWDFAFFVQSEAFFALTTLLLLIVFFLIRRSAVAIPGWTRPDEKPAFWKKSLRGLLALAILAAVSVGWYAWQQKTFVFAENRPLVSIGLLEKNCAHCHDPYRAFHYLKEPEQWRVTVTRMREVEGAPVSEETAEKVIELLQHRASYSDAYLYRAKCLKCHGRSEATARDKTSEEWKLLIGRMERLSPYAYRSEWRRQLTRYAEQNLAVPEPESADELDRYHGKVRFETVCGSCHQLLLVTESAEPKDNPRKLVERMHGKAPAYFKPGDLDTIPGFLSSLPEDEAEFSAMFPHDKIVEAKW
jgi:hypothetical protein